MFCLLIGVAAAITGPPEAEIDAGDGALYSWVASIRQIYLTSTRYVPAASHEHQDDCSSFDL